MITVKDIYNENQKEKDDFFIHLNKTKEDEFDPLTVGLWEGWLKDVPSEYMRYEVTHIGQSLKDSENGVTGYHLEIREIKSEEDGHVNMFKYPLTEKEQFELSDLLDKFLQMYENNFADQLIGDREDDSDTLLYEFKSLYELVDKLFTKALN